MISVILVEPKLSANVGAISRTMKNFNFTSLILINPRCNHLSQMAKNRAKHANDVLEKAKIKTESYLKTFDYLISTTARLGKDYNIPRSPISPKQLAEKLADIDKKKKIGILIGRESDGLTNEEILNSDFTVSIPSSPKYGTLNISHAVSIILYELFQISSQIKTTDHFVTASKIEKEVILKKIDQILDKMQFTTKEKKQTQKIIWKRILGKSFLTKREAFALIGFLNKIK
ncbi:MAG: RNA methyltransferase [Nanoarchaeota archaeon]